MEVGVLGNSVLNGSDIDGGEEPLEAVIRAQIDKGDFRFMELLASGISTGGKG